MEHFTYQTEINSKYEYLQSEAFWVSIQCIDIICDIYHNPDNHHREQLLRISTLTTNSCEQQQLYITTQLDHDKATTSSLYMFCGIYWPWQPWVTPIIVYFASYHWQSTTVSSLKNHQREQHLHILTLTTNSCEQQQLYFSTKLDRDKTTCK